MRESSGAHPGQEAPEIDLPVVRADGTDRWRLSAFRGQPVVLFFYPGDETPVCTRQLCSVRDHWEDYRRTGAEIVGINTDSVEKHRRFIANHQFPFPLLVDAEGLVVQAYEMSNFLGVRRGVVVIDSDGIVRYRKVVFPLFRPSDDEVLDVIKSLH
jgi:thioredoxin-dependent peroxiredoxin